MIGPVSEQPSEESQSNDKPKVENFSHTPVAARVPEKVGRGLFCTGQVILDSPKEFVVDFMQGVTRPFQAVSRAVLTPQTVTEFTDALQKNLDMYTTTYGPP